MKIVIIDYGAGNIKSVQFAIERLGYQAILSNSITEIKNADKVIFPGVGEASSAMKKLKDVGLDKEIPNLRNPLLGICLGMQLMCEATEEGNTKGLGIFHTSVIKFSSMLKVPQIGWNTIQNLQGDLFQGISEDTYMYAVHSYYAPLCKETIAITEYGVPYAAALQKDNFYGTQFHPEKSGSKGEMLLANFLNL